MDIVAGLVDFANRHIAERYPNFSFVTLQQDNPAYDTWRHEGTSRTIASLEEACAPETIDLCIATSLFTSSECYTEIGPADRIMSRGRTS